MATTNLAWSISNYFTAILGWGLMIIMLTHFGKILDITMFSLCLVVRAQNFWCSIYDDITALVTLLI